MLRSVDAPCVVTRDAWRCATHQNQQIFVAQISLSVCIQARSQGIPFANRFGQQLSVWLLTEMSEIGRKNTQNAALETDFVS
jgi:hypothetical protein